MSAIASALATQFPDRDSGWSVQVDPASRRGRGRAADDAPRPLRRRRIRAPHRLRERGRSAPRPRHFARAGDGDPHGSRRRTRPDPLAAADGEPAPRAPGRRRWACSLARWGVALSSRSVPADLTGLALVQLSPAVLAFTLVVSILTAGLFGLAPALAGSRARRAGVAEGRGPRRRRRRADAGAAQGLRRRGGRARRRPPRRRRADVEELSTPSAASIPASTAQGVLTARVTLPGDQYEEDPVLALLRGGRRRAARLPGVRDAGAVSFLPFTGLAAATGFTIVGQPVAAPGRRSPGPRSASATTATSASCASRSSRGRTFTDREMREKSGVVLVTQGFAKKFFPGQDPSARRSWST